MFLLADKYPDITASKAGKPKIVLEIALTIFNSVCPPSINPLRKSELRNEFDKACQAALVEFIRPSKL